MGIIYRIFIIIPNIKCPKSQPFGLFCGMNNACFYLGCVWFKKKRRYNKFCLSLFECYFGLVNMVIIQFIS